MTCSLNMHLSQIVNLLFVISDARRSQLSEKLQIDLRGLNISDTSDMKDKVLRIIRDALGADDLQGAIQ